MSTAESPLSVAALVLSFNQRDFVREGLQSVLAQDLALEIVIVDDGSTDGSQDEIDRVLAESADRNVRFIKHEKNRGVVAALNSAVAATRADFAICFHVDDVSMPGRARALADSARSAPDVWVFGSRFSVQNMPGAGRFWEDGPDYPSEPWNRDQARHSEEAYVYGCVAAFRTDLWRIFGPLDERSHFEDLALGIRGLLAGRAWYVPERLVRYRLSPINSSRRPATYELDLDSVRNFHAQRTKVTARHLLAIEPDLAVAYQRWPDRRESIASFEQRCIAPLRLAATLDQAVANLPRRSWLLPALRSALRPAFPGQRRIALRALAIGIAPAVFFGLKRIRGVFGRLRRRAN